MSKVFLSGFFGAPNLGDEAVALAGAQSIAKNHPNAEVIIGTFDEDVSRRFVGERFSYIKARYPGQFAIKEAWRLTRLLKDVDVIVYPGGGILQNVHSYSLLHQSALYVILGIFYGIPVYGFGLGIGPLTNDYGRRLAKFILEGFEFSTVRDEVSKREAVRLVTTNRVPTLAVDSAFCIRFNQGPKQRNKVGIIFRKWPNVRVEDIAHLIECIREDGKEPVLIICESRVDTDFYSEIQNKLKVKIEVKDIQNLDEAFNVISGLEKLISMRLHPLIFGIKAGVPVVAVSYDHKVSELMKRHNLGDYCLNVGASADQIFKKYKVAETSNQDLVSQSICTAQEMFLSVNFEKINYGWKRKIEAILLLLQIIGFVFFWKVKCKCVKQVKRK